MTGKVTVSDHARRKSRYAGEDVLANTKKEMLEDGGSSLFLRAGTTQ
jgi:hypothetical protein